MNKERELIAKCGFYCGSCPVYSRGECLGCRMAHQPGDCFTFDCVDREGVAYCGLCAHFPCGELMVREKATVLSPEWLAWMRRRQSSAKR